MDPTLPDIRRLLEQCNSIIEKGKKYLKAGQNPPKGVTLRIGPKKGRYYLVEDKHLKIGGQHHKLIRGVSVTRDQWAELKHHWTAAGAKSVEFINKPNNAKNDAGKNLYSIYVNFGDSTQKEIEAKHKADQIKFGKRKPKVPEHTRQMPLSDADEPGELYQDWTKKTFRTAAAAEQQMKVMQPLGYEFRDFTSENTGANRIHTVEVRKKPVEEIPAETPQKPNKKEQFKSDWAKLKKFISDCEKGLTDAERARMHKEERAAEEYERKRVEERMKDPKVQDMLRRQAEKNAPCPPLTIPEYHGEQYIHVDSPYEDVAENINNLKREGWQYQSRRPKTWSTSIRSPEEWKFIHKWLYDRNLGYTTDELDRAKSPPAITGTNAITFVHDPKKKQAWLTKVDSYASDTGDFGTQLIEPAIESEGKRTFEITEDGLYQGQESGMPYRRWFEVKDGKITEMQDSGEFRQKAKLLPKTTAREIADRIHKDQEARRQAALPKDPDLNSISNKIAAIPALTPGPVFRVSGNTFEHKEWIKAIPGRRWNGDRREWEIPVPKDGEQMKKLIDEFNARGLIYQSGGVSSL